MKNSDKISKTVVKTRIFLNILDKIDKKLIKFYSFLLQTLKNYDTMIDGEERSFSL